MYLLYTLTELLPIRCTSKQILSNKLLLWQFNEVLPLLTSHTFSHDMFKKASKCFFFHSYSHDDNSDLGEQCYQTDHKIAWESKE